MEIGKPKRIYEQATAGTVEQGFTVLLDGRGVKTPAKQKLVVPNHQLASAMAAEWMAQGDEIDPFTMPLTQMANSAIDRTGPQRGDIIETVAAYGGTDLICYWADEPDDLIDLQRAAWQPLLDWATDDLGLSLTVTSGIIHADQDAKTLAGFRQLVAELDDFRLTGFANAVSALGSLVIGLALLRGRLDAKAAFEASQVDESYQISLWGEDWEQTEKRERLQADIEAIERYLSLLNAPA